MYIYTWFILYNIYIWIGTKLYMLPIEFNLYNHKSHIWYWRFSKAVRGVEDMMWVTRAVWTLKSFTWILTACMLLGRGWGCKLAVALRRFNLVDSSANHCSLEFMINLYMILLVFIIIVNQVHISLLWNH